MISTYIEVQRHIAKYPEIEKWIIKKPNLCSGVGHKQFTLDKLNENLISKYLGTLFFYY